ncbi:MAG: hypothetical protein Q9163_000294 [Psora crenata]
MSVRQTDMQTGHAMIEKRFDGNYNSDGGSLVLGSSFNTNGGSIIFDSRPNNRPPTSICELPDFILSPYFTGRSEELQQLDRVFSTSSGNLPQRCIIRGMPGVGKTQLALKFATVASNKGEYSYVFWVSAVSVGKLTRDFSKLADIVRLPRRYKLDQGSKLTAMRAWLEDPPAARSWLVVLDNISEETAIMLRDILPRRACGGRLLMTTRIATVADIFAAPGASSQLALQPPRISEAAEMLFASANLERQGREEASYADAVRLVQSVGNLPLAIDQAASYMRETGSSPRDVLDVYKSDEVPEMLSWENDLCQHEEKSVVATFTPAVNKIQKNAPDAVTLLRVLCFCDPEGIPITIFQQGCDALYTEIYTENQYGSPEARAVGLQNAGKTQGNDKLEAVIDLFRSRIRLSKAIQAVQRLSLAAQTLEDSDRIVRIHDLVHFLLRTMLMTDAERRQWLEIAICIICKAFEVIGDRRSPKNWSRCSRFISHIESLEGFAEQYRVKNTKLWDASTWAALHLEDCGLYEKAATLNKRILEEKKNILGGQDPSTLLSMNNLAGVLNSLGNYEEAEAIHRQTLALRESVLGKEHPDTLTSMSNLASVLSSQSKYNEAEAISRRTSILRESVLGKEHPNTLTSINNLALILSSQGKHSEAEAISRRTSILRESVLGEEHPDTLTSMNNLASVLSCQGKHNEAEAIYRRTSILRESVLGKEHPDTLTSMNNLAIVLSSQGKHNEAEAISRQTSILRESVLGKEHPDTLTSMNNLASVLNNQGKYNEAEAIFRRISALKESVLGKEHPDTLVYINNLASVLNNQGKYNEAEAIFRRTLALRESILGKEHPSTLTCVDCLANLLHHKGQYDDAGPLYRRAYAGYRKTLGDEHPKTRSMLGELLLPH